MMGTLGGGQNIWTISADERAKHDQQFFAIKPVAGFITGDQARGLFVKSGLPSQVLAQIWELADFNKDGRMDRKEFSIAMHLIQKKLQGFTLPTVLPDSLKMDPSPAIGTFGPGSGMQLGGVPLATPLPVMQGGGPGYFAPPGVAQFPMHAGQPGGMMGIPPMAPMGMPYAGMPGAVPMMPSMTPQPSTFGNGMPSTSTRRDSKSALSIDWSMPQGVKLKYSQMFNGLDKGRLGALSGPQARGILGQSGLTHQVLAQVWTMSDLDKDGKLTCDEFCIAMHLIDMVKGGATLPASLPPELLPASRARTISTGSFGSAQQGSMESATGAAAALGDQFGAGLGEEDPQKYHPASFEDRRKQNFDKGQAELDRRRQLLQDEERRLREERERKDREEFERLERERMERERRRQLEIEKQMAKQREAQQKQEEEYKKMMEQREAARRELERQRQLEWEKNKIQELTMLRQREVESVCHLKQKQKNLQFQLQALTEKSQDTNTSITGVRERIVDITRGIEGMKVSRDQKVSDMESLRRQIQECTHQLSVLTHDRQGLQQRTQALGDGSKISESYRQVMHSYHNKELSMENLRQALVDLDREIQTKQSADDVHSRIEGLRNGLNDLTAENQELAQKLQAKQYEVSAVNDERIAARLAAELQQQQISTVNHVGHVDAAAPMADAFVSSAAADAWPVSNDAWGSSEATTNNADWPETAKSGDGFDTAPWPVAGDDWASSGDGKQQQRKAVVEGDQPVTVRYKAVFEFVARGDDELSFQPGDIILVYKDHVAEPGWLAGQFQDKVGWFPADYAECIDQPSDAEPGGGSAGSPDKTNWAPNLDGIQEEGANVPSLAAVNGTTAHSSEWTEGSLVVQAIYPWKAKKDDHLTLKKGDCIKVIRQEEMWWFGELDGRQGLFPKSCVKLIGGPRRASAASKTADEPPSTADGHSSPVSEEPAPPKDDSGAVEGEWYVASYPFIPVESGDLGFEVGERILVIAKDNEWWTGRVGDREGIFPANYVLKASPDAVAGGVIPKSDSGSAPPRNVGRADSQQSIKSNASQNQQQPSTPKEAEGGFVEVAQAIAPFTATVANQLSLTPGDLVRIRTKSPQGWWEGEVQKKGSAEKHIGWFPGHFVKVLGQKSVQRLDSQSSLGSSTGGKEVYTALFDYEPQQPDELQFKKGDRITLLHRVDDSWNMGRVGDREGLFPSNYVNADTRLEQAKKELVQTEKKYTEDLELVRQVFMDPIRHSRTLSTEDVKNLFVNWVELIEVSRKFVSALLNKSVGDAILAVLPHLQVYVTFCQFQQNSFDLLETKLKNMPEFRRVHDACVKNPHSMNLPLSHYLLLPVTRVTKYPLVVEKILQHTDAASPDHNCLQRGFEGLKALVAEVNKGAVEMNNWQMLYWCQTHVKCETLRPKLVFHSPTNALGPRKFVHSGILFKAKSNRLLIGLLFNDFLLLSTPDEQIDHPDSFKLNRNSDIVLSIYKQPFLLCKLSLQPGNALGDGQGGDDCSMMIASDDVPATVVQLKAVNNIAKHMWAKQLEKAIQDAKRITQIGSRLWSHSPLSKNAALGRLLVEIVCVRQMTIPAELNTCMVFCHLSFDSQEHRAYIHVEKPDTLLTTQFMMYSCKSERLQIKLGIELPLAPDLCLGTADINLEELLQAGLKKVPAVKQYPLLSDLVPDANGFVIVKLVVLMFQQ